MRKLNGWQRIGVVLSLIWLPVGFFYGTGQAMDAATAAVTYRLRLCMAADGSDYNACEVPFQRDWAVAVAHSDHWLWGACMAIVPVLACWFLIWALVRIVRWVAAGGFSLQRS